MTRRYRRPETDYRGPSRGPGYAASPMESECPRCGRDIEDWRDACKIRGRWIHKSCHGDGDE